MSALAHTHSLPRDLRIVAAWFKTPAGGVALLIVATFLVRVLFACALGLGIDESYMVAAGRKLQLSYFDHPPIAWWLAWWASNLTGSESPLVVRLPFIALFALTTLLMYRVTAFLFGPRAGLWAAIVLNLAPVLSISTGTWVLPDGPLLAALLGATVCLIAALPSNGRVAWGWWLGAGACAGLALCSKYSAVLTIIGLIVFLVTEPTSRRWLARPHPYVAGLLASAMFLPVLIWNAENGWVSFLFQGGRAIGWLRPFGPISSLAGEAAFLLPWIWAPLMVCGFRALRRGPHDKRRWLLVCLGAPPIAVFTVASAACGLAPSAGWLIGFVAVLVYGSTEVAEDERATREYEPPAYADYAPSATSSAAPSSGASSSEDYSFSPTSPYAPGSSGYEAASASAPTEITTPPQESEPYGGAQPY